MRERKRKSENERGREKVWNTICREREGGGNMFGRGKKEQGEKEGRDRGGWEREEKKNGEGGCCGPVAIAWPERPVFFLPFRPRPKEPFFLLIETRNIHQWMTQITLKLILKSMAYLNNWVCLENISRSIHESPGARAQWSN